jgi:uncharacterized membrane protein YphA (DoxX/SURF4 family)
MLASVGDLLLRIAVGGFLIPHGVQKLFGWFGADLAAERRVFEEVEGRIATTRISSAWRAGSPLPGLRDSGRRSRTFRSRS